MGVEGKKKIVEEVKEKIERSSCVCFTNYKGLSASRMNELRRALAGKNAEMKVFKNRLIMRALKENSLKELYNFIDGPMALVFGYDDPIQPIKIISDFKKEEDKPVIIGGYLDGNVFDRESLMVLASIPGRSELYERMVGSLAAPLNRLVYILSGIQMKLLSILSLLVKQKEE